MPVSFPRVIRPTTSKMVTPSTSRVVIFRLTVADSSGFTAVPAGRLLSLRGEILVAGDTPVNARGTYDGPADAGLLVGEFCAGVEQVRTVPDFLNAGGND